MRAILKWILILAAALVLPAAAFGQTSTVTGTIVDPNGVPYGGGTVTAQLTSPGATVTNNSQQQCVSAGLGSAPCQMPIPGTVGPAPLDPTGSFTLNLYSNTSIQPGGTQWVFTVGIAPGVLPPWGTGPQSFSTPITITGGSQSISSTLNSHAPALTRPVGSGTIGGTCAATEVAFGSSVNTITCVPTFTFISPNLTIPANGIYQIGGSDYVNPGPAAGNNLGLGPSTISAMTSGVNNVAIGPFAMNLTTTGQGNVAVGVGALFDEGATASFNTGLGESALEHVTSNSNTAVGANALLTLTSGSGDVAVGDGALQNTTGSNNTALGFSAGLNLTTGSGNIIIGPNNLSAVTTGSNNIAIGTGLAAPPLAASNEIDIGDVFFVTGTNVPNTSIVTFPGNVLSGTDGSVAGLFQAANGSSGAHTDWGSQATTSSEVDGPSTPIATGNLVSMTTVGAVQKLTDSGLSAASVATPIRVDRTAQSAAITSTTLVSCPASPAGGTNYLLSSNAKVTTAATSSSTLGPLSITYTTPDGTTFTNFPVAYRIAPTGTAIDTAGDTSNGTTTFDAGFPFEVNCQAGSTITYAMGYASTGVTAMVYDLHIRVLPQ